MTLTTMPFTRARGSTGRATLCAANVADVATSVAHMSRNTVEHLPRSGILHAASIRHSRMMKSNSGEAPPQEVYRDFHRNTAAAV
jgi:hypothetical protein